MTASVKISQDMRGDGRKGERTTGKGKRWQDRTEKDRKMRRVFSSHFA
jgi:hypothetical protein